MRTRLVIAIIIASVTTYCLVAMTKSFLSDEPRIIVAVVIAVVIAYTVAHVVVLRK